MASGEQNITALPVKTNTGVANSDYFMGIDSAEGYQILIRDVAKYIMENYNGSTLAGQAQTPKAAIDALNNKTTITPVYREQSNYVFDINPTIIRRANIVIINGVLNCYTPVSTSPGEVILSGLPGPASVVYASFVNPFDNTAQAIRLYINANGDLFARFGKANSTGYDFVLTYSVT